MGNEGWGFTMRVLTWNVEWATSRSWRAPEIVNRINGYDPEVVCLTEADTGLLPEFGHSIGSQADYGYSVGKRRRKVILRSREPWQSVDDVGLDSMPSGRFVSGVTQTSIGEVRVVGVCIPWFGSRTEARRESNRKNRWEDHETYLVGLIKVLKELPSERLIVMGDFNQIIGPDSRAPKRLQRLLQDAFRPSVRIATSEVDFEGLRSIDHIGISEDLLVESTYVLSNAHDERKLSDHYGVAAEVSVR